MGRFEFSKPYSRAVLRSEHAQYEVLSPLPILFVADNHELHHAVFENPRLRPIKVRARSSRHQLIRQVALLISHKVILIDPLP
jgi:hypothetical protein